MADFVGRGEMIERMVAKTRAAAGSAPVMHLVDGMAGSGKTTLAVHVARRLAESYPDGRLFIDLQGHGAGNPVEPGAALVVLLRQLGVPADRIPADLEERRGLWRRELATRRVVIVLDNVADSRQVTPLLPVSSWSVVLVTSRRRLSDLDVGPPESLSVLTYDEGLRLLATNVGVERVRAEPEAAAEIVRRCGHLPLAIRLVGARLAHRRSRRLADLAARLAVEESGLATFGTGDRSVASAFGASYEQLTERAKELFRMLSVHPGAEFDATIASAVSRLPYDVTIEVLEELLDFHLIEEARAGSYRMHDLIRQYAHELSTRTDSAEVRENAFSELIDLVLNVVFPVADTLESGSVRWHVNLDAPRRPDLLRVLGEPTEERVETERVDLVSLVQWSCRWGRYRQAWQLARSLWRFLFIRGYYDDIIVTHLAGLAAAQATADESAIAVMHNYLASAYTRTGNYSGALKHVKEAVSICEGNGDLSNLTRYRLNLGAVHWLLGELEEAVSVGLDGLRGTARYEVGEVTNVLPNLGLVLALLGRYDEALRLHRLHLYLARQRRDQFHLLNALSHIGAVKCRMGRYEAARRALRAALVLRERTGHRYAEPEVRNDLGVALRGLGRTDEAVVEHETARKLAVESGEPHAEAAALNDLALTLAGSADAARLIGLHREALRVATRIAHPYEQGRALAGVAENLVATDPVEARRHWERALAIFRRMGVPERSEVERRLAESVLARR